MMVSGMLGVGVAWSAETLRLPGDAGTAPPASEIVVPDGAEKAFVAAACRKICRVGKPCGNTCIARDKTCHRSGGCACAAGY